MADPEHSPSRIDALMVGMPWHARLLLIMGMTFGVPSIMVGFWLAQQAGWIENPVVQSLEHIKGITLQHELTMHEVSKGLYQNAEELRKVRERWQYRCVMRAKTDDQRKACFPKENGD